MPKSFLRRAPLTRCNKIKFGVPQFEPLEPRVVLTGGVLITELLAANNNGIEDFDDDRSDWFEVLNSGIAAIDLKGYYVTDDRDDLTQWEIPVETVLPARERMLIFASGKDFVASNGELHTNFRLESNGDFLALVEPDGVSIASGFSAELPDGRVGFPQQFEDISYGIEPASRQLTWVHQDTDIEYLVPTSAAELNPQWNQVGFTDPDNVWTTSAGGNAIGMDTGQELGPTDDLLGYWALDEENGTIAADVSIHDRDAVVVDAVFDPAGGVTGGAVRFDGDRSHVNIGDTLTLDPTDGITVSAWVNLSSDRTTLFNGVHVLLSQGSLTDVTSLLLVKESHLSLTFTQATGESLSIEGTEKIAASDGWVHVAFTVTVAADGQPGQVTLYQQGRIAGTVTYDATTLPAPPQPVVLGQLARLDPGVGLDGLLDDVAIWDRALSGQEIASLRSGSTPAALAQPSNEVYGDLIQTDVTSAMQGRNASAFVRAEFDAPDLQNVNGLNLRIRSDDGFVAYLNGEEIARRNAPMEPAWNSAATGRHEDREAIQFEEIPLVANRLLRDFNITKQGLFVVDLPNGTYDVKLSQGDQERLRDQTAISLERVQVDTVSTDAGEYVVNTYRVAVNDGRLALEIKDLGGQTGNSTISALEVLPVGPSDSSNTFRFDFGTNDSLREPGYTGISDTSSYTSQRGFGWLSGKILARDIVPDVELLSLLQPANNVLAIHGLNFGVDNPDFLLQTELVATEQIFDSTNTRYFAQPTPLTANDAGKPNVASPPLVSVPGATFVDEFFLELTTDIPAGVIYYTTDNSVPNLSSNVYDPLSPILIDARTQVRAIVSAPDHVDSPVVSQTYNRLAQDLVDFTSQISLVVLNNLDASRFNGFRQTNVHWSIFEPDPESGLSSLRNLPQLQTRAGVKTRGSSSQEFSKKAFNVEAWNEKNQDKDVSPLGLPAESDWILNARYTYDRALMRNPFIYELSNQTGRYAVRTRFVEVFVNSDEVLNRDDYVGVYTLMEKIKRGTDRLDVEELSKNYDTEPLITGGFILKIDRPDPGDRGFGAGGETLLYVDPKEEEMEQPIRQPQVDYIRGYINDVAASLTNSDPDTGYPSLIDVDAWIDHHLLNVLTKNPDAFVLSTYLFKRREGKLEFGPIWDFDRTMGNDVDGRANNPIGWEPVGPYHFLGGRPGARWYHILLDDPDFRQRYADRYQQLRKGPWNTDNMNAIIASMAAQIGVDAANRNFEHWSLVQPNSGSPASWLGEVEDLRQWLQTRVNWLDEQLIPQPIITPSPEHQTTGLGGLPLESIAFDFGTDDSPVADGYIGIGDHAYDDAAGYGWTSGDLRALDRQVSDELGRDLVVIDSHSATFSVNLDNGDYDVRLLMGDPDRPRDQMQVRFEPDEKNLVRDLVTVTGDWHHRRTYRVQVTDGQLNVELSDLGGQTDRSVINALVVTPVDDLAASLPVGTEFTLSLPEDAPEGASILYTLDGSEPRMPFAEVDPRVRDFNATANGSFVVDVSNGHYDVTVTHGDLIKVRDQTVLLLEGVQANAEPINTGFGEFVSITYPVEVTDGQLTLTLQDLGGESAFSVINSLRIIPTGGSEGFAFDFGTLSSPVEMGYIQIDHEFTYHAETGYGWTDGKIASQNRSSVTDVSPTAMVYQGEVITINEPGAIRARTYVPESSKTLGPRKEFTLKWSGAIERLFAVEEPKLAITEINYHPSEPNGEELSADASVTGRDFEFIELTNLGPGPFALTDYSLSGGVDFTFPQFMLEEGDHAVLVSDYAAFQLRYGESAAVIGEFSGRMSNGGERLRLSDSDGITLFDFQYRDDDPWPHRADGAGATLELIDPAYAPPDQYGKYYQWRGSTQSGGSPGTAGADPIGVVINEVLSQGDPGDEEPITIELFNPTENVIDVGGLYLGDSVTPSLTFEIAEGTTIAAGGYLVLSQDVLIPTQVNAGTSQLSAQNNGAIDVWLLMADASGHVTHFVDDVHLGPIAIGESWGRTTNGNGRLAPLAQATPGQQNGLPRVGSIVISEIQFNPSEPSAEALQIEPGLDARDLEFLEIHNPTAATQDLTLWQIRGGVDWDFAPGAVIELDQSLVVISFDPDSSENVNRLAAFRQHYALEADVSLVGGYSGNLSNSGEIVQLLRRVVPLDGGQTTVYHVLEEETIYDDRDPWPTEADGAGSALNRTHAGAFSNSPTSWTAQVPSPGLADLVFAGDMDMDGDVDFDDIDDLLTAINDADAYQQRFGASALLNGDINKDGKIDDTDIDRFVAALFQGRR